MTGFVLARLVSGKEKKTLEEIERSKGVNKVDVVFGRWDLVVTVEAGNLNSLTSMVIKKIRSIDGVAATETLIATAL